MRIALATSSYAPYIGGVEEHVRNVAAVLRDRGHDVVVWTVDRAGGFGVTEIDGIEVWSLPAPLPARSVSSMGRFAATAPRAAYFWNRAFRSHRPQVIHVQCFGPNGTYARYLAQLHGTPMIVSAHGETVMDDGGVFQDSRFAMASLRRSLSVAAAVTGCSQYALDDLIERFGLGRGAGTVVFNGIDTDEEVGPPPAGASGRYIAAVGRVQRKKGFDLLIDAFASARLPDEIRLVLGGGGPELDALRAQVAAVGIEDRVIFAGWLDRPTIAGLLHGAEIGVVPSRLEPFGITVLEIWRAGIPVVATSLGGPPEFVEDNIDGLLVDPNDKAALATALSELVANSSRSREIGQAGFAKVQTFTWDRTVDAYEEIYKGLPGRRAR
jgi:glycogen(starch) synthase